MFCIGLTGNIASGKSTAMNYFFDLGAAVISADNIAHDLTSDGQVAYKEIVHYFGSTILTKTGDINRKSLRELAFNNIHHRLWLENLLHPLIRQTIIDKIAKLGDKPYCVIEIPLLKNRNDYPYLDRILVLLADKNLQLTRVMERDTCSRSQAELILQTQPAEIERRQIADDLIINHGSKQKLLNNIKKLHNKYLQLAAQKSS